MKKYLMASAAVATLIAHMPALAQNSANTNVDGLEEVVVSGLRASLREALDTKKESTGVVEVVSSKDIGVLPDVTIAETLNQIPGVNTTRDRGNDSQAAIGGLGPRLALGLINGREMATSEPDRNVRWEIFPSEVVSGIEIHKSSEADLITGGISGTVDIQTIRPLDYSGPALTVRGGPVYYTGGSAYPDQDDLGYRFSGAYVDKLTPDFGVVVAGSYQDQKNGYEDVQGGGWNFGPGNSPGPIVPGGPTVATPWGASWEGKAIDTKRGAVSTTAQWKPTTYFEARADVLYSFENIDEHDQGAWVSNWGNWAGGNVGDYLNNVIQNGALVATTISPAANSQINSEIARYRQDMSLFATGLNGKWTANSWQVTGDLAYSQAERSSLWQSIVFGNSAGQMSYNYTGDKPSVTAQTSAWDAAESGTLYAESGNGAVSHVLDTLKTASLDAFDDLGDGFLDGVKMGLRFSQRQKDDAGGGPTASGSAQATNGTPSPSPILSSIPASWFTPFNYKTLTAPTMLSGDYDKLVGLVYGSAGAAELDPDFHDTPFTSHVKETTEDAYLEGFYEASLGGRPLTGNFGVHVVHVNTDSAAPGLDEGNSYTKALPSVNAKWDLGNDNYIKAGFAEVLSRPALNDLRADRVLYVNTPPYSGSGGNPKLKPYTADQVNLDYEIYFHKDGLFAANLYYKRISNYIGYGTRTVDLPGYSLPFTFTSPYNAQKDGNLEGVEFTFQTPFFFIPHLENFGVYSNVSIVRSNIHENSPAGNPFPMNGVAKESGAFDVYYADDKVESRVGLKYHSTFTTLYGWDASSSGLSAIRPELTLDYSATYRFSDNLSARFQAGNLLNTPLRTYDYNNPAMIDRTDYYGRRFLFDMTFKY